MATPHPASTLSGLALRLVRDGLLSTADAERLQNDAQNNKLPFVTHLVESKKLSSAVIARAASEEFGVPLFEISTLDMEAAPIKLVDEKIIRRHRVLPIYKRGTKLYIAITDPTNLQA